MQNENNLTILLDLEWIGWMRLTFWVHCSIELKEWRSSKSNFQGNSPPILSKNLFTNSQAKLKWMDTEFLLLQKVSRDVTL